MESSTAMSESKSRGDSHNSHDINTNDADLTKEAPELETPGLALEKESSDWNEDNSNDNETARFLGEENRNDEITIAANSNATESTTDMNNTDKIRKWGIFNALNPNTAPKSAEETNLNPNLPQDSSNRDQLNPESEALHHEGGTQNYISSSDDDPDSDCDASKPNPNDKNKSIACVDSPLDDINSSSDGERKSLIQSQPQPQPDLPPNSESESQSRRSHFSEQFQFLKKLSQRKDKDLEEEKNDEIRSRLLESQSQSQSEVMGSSSSSQDDIDYNDDNNQGTGTEEGENASDDNKTNNDTLNSNSHPESKDRVGELVGNTHNGKNEPVLSNQQNQNTVAVPVGQKFTGMIKAFQTRRLRARSDIDEKNLSEQDIKTLSQAVVVVRDTKSMQSMDIAEDPLEAKSNMNWRQKIRAITSAAFAPDEYIDRLADPEDGKEGMGFYKNLPADDDDSISDGLDGHKASASQLAGQEMRQMRVRVEGDKVTLGDEMADLMDVDSDFEIPPDEPGGYYSTIVPNDSDDQSSSSYSRMISENKHLLEKIRLLEEDLRNSNEEKEMWKLKAMQLQKDLGELSKTTSILSDENSVGSNEEDRKSVV